MRRLVRWLIVLTVLAALVGGGLLATGPVQAYLKARFAPHYTTLAVTRGPIDTTVNSTGTVKAVRSVSIGAFVSGPISEIYVDFNSVVKKDQLLARIDPRLLSANMERDKATLATQKADLQRVEALLQQAVNNELRAIKLSQQNKDYLSDTERDQYTFTRKSLEAQLALSKAQIQQAEASLKNSQANLEYTEIRSPVDGIIIERKVDPGQTVAASFQTPEMFIIAPDLDKAMHVFASVDEADIGQIASAQKREQPVHFTVDAYPSDVFQGKIDQIRKSASTTQNVVTYPVVIVTTNPELKLLPGMTANISFQIEQRAKVLRVPTAALRFVPTPAQARPEDKKYIDNPAGDQPARLTASEKAELSKNRSRRIVWVRDGERVRAVPVVLGLSNNQYAELLEGDLKDGQKLVTGLDALWSAEQKEIVDRDVDEESP